MKLINALPNYLEGQVVAKGFGGLLNFKPNYLKRDVSSWLMRKFNPETMKLEIGGDKEINVSHHAVWCAMQIPNAGGDPLPMSDADARAERDRIGLQIVGPSYNSRKGITVKHITAGLKNRSLTEIPDFAFFVLLNFSICWATNSHRSFISLWFIIFLTWLHKTLTVANPVFSLFTSTHGSHTESSHFCIIKVKLVRCFY
jgi:hypothetical protein